MQGVSGEIFNNGHYLPFIVVFSVVSQDFDGHGEYLNVIASVFSLKSKEKEQF